MCSAAVCRPFHTASVHPQLTVRFMPLCQFLSCCTCHGSWLTAECHGLVQRNHHWSMIGSLTSLGACCSSQVHPVTAENQFHCTRLYSRCWLEEGRLVSLVLSRGMVHRGSADTVHQKELESMLPHKACVWLMLRPRETFIHHGPCSAV